MEMRKSCKRRQRKKGVCGVLVTLPHQEGVEKIHYCHNEALEKAGQSSHIDMKWLVRLQKADRVGSSFVLFCFVCFVLF